MARMYKRTTLFCVVLTAMLAGVALTRLWKAGLPGWYVWAALLFAGAMYRQRRAVSVVSLVVLGLTIGLWRGGHFMQQIAPYHSLDGKKVTVRVQADSSGVYTTGSQLQFDGSHVTIIEPYKLSMPGMMVISGYGENSVLRGDVVTVSGKLYSRRGGKQAGISFGQLHVEARSASLLEKFRRNFLAGLNTALPEPHDQFAAGLLIGQRSELPQKVTDTLQIVGLSHVIAVSGYNLTIMAEVARKRLGKSSKYRSTLVSIGLILLFLGIAGSSASIARAAFVSILTVVAAHYGRSVKPLLLILLAACYTTLMNPLNLWTDIGWYLSFLAFFGVLIIGPAIQQRYFSKKEPGAVVQLLIETSSAQIMTIPIMMYIFGQVSLISLVANVLVVPLVPLAMLLSVVAGVAGMLVPAFAGILAWPARMLLGFMLGICGLLARVPHALSATKITTGLMVLLYATVIVLIVILRHKTAKYAKITAE